MSCEISSKCFLSSCFLDFLILLKVICIQIFFSAVCILIFVVFNVSFYLYLIVFGFFFAIMPFNFFRVKVSLIKIHRFFSPCRTKFIFVLRRKKGFEEEKCFVCMTKNMIHDENFVLLVKSEIHCEFFFFFCILSPYHDLKKKKKIDENIEAKLASNITVFLFMYSQKVQ